MAFHKSGQISSTYMTFLAFLKQFLAKSHLVTRQSCQTVTFWTFGKIMSEYDNKTFSNHAFTVSYTCSTMYFLHKYTYIYKESSLYNM